MGMNNQAWNTITDKFCRLRFFGPWRDLTMRYVLSQPRHSSLFVSQ